MNIQTQPFGNTEINLPIRANLVTQSTLSILENVRTSKTSCSNTPVRRLNQQLSDRCSFQSILSVFTTVVSTVGTKQDDHCYV